MIKKRCLFGLILGVIFIKTRSIWPGVAGHYLFNFLSMILLWLFWWLVQLLNTACLSHSEGHRGVGSVSNWKAI
ncbi:MAG: CPBP family glutamic-type intramembrane protease [Candidatus Thorarchaeota archaeon]